MTTQALTTTQSTGNSALAERPTSSPAVRPGFHSIDSLTLLVKLAEIFASSHLVPVLYRGNKANCMIAVAMASRMGMDPMTVMQNLYLIQGKPSWSSQFLIANWNTCGRFTPIRYEWAADRKSCRAWSEDLKTGEKLIGTTITMTMAKAEGWLDKPGSKWLTMPEQMLMYRAAAFLCRAYAAEISLGIITAEETEDVTGGSMQQGHNLPNLAGVVSANNGTAGKKEEPAKIAVAEVAETSVDLKTVLPAEAVLVTETIVSETPAEVTSPSPAVTQVEVVQTVQPSQAVGNDGKTRLNGQFEVPVQPAETKTLEPPTSTTTQEGPITQTTLETLATLVKELAPPKDKWKASLQNKFGQHVTAIKHLTEAQGQGMIAWATKAVDKKRLESWATGQTQPTGTASEGTGDNSPPFQT